MPLVLRASALWGTYVVAMHEVAEGGFVRLGDADHGALPRPEGSSAPDVVIAPKANGWELDPRGATGGTLHLSGMRHDLTQLGGVNAQLAAGDYGLVEYGSYALLFQVTQAAPLLERIRRSEGELALGFVFALLLVGGALGFARSVSGWDDPKPTALSSPAELAQRFHVDVGPAASRSEPLATHQPAPSEPSAIEAQSSELALAVSEIGRAGPAPRAVNTRDVSAESMEGALGAGTPLSVRPDGPHQGLSPLSVYRVIAPRLSSLYACYAFAPDTASDELYASLAVEPNGHINERVNVRSGIGSGVVERCVARKIGHLEFTPASKPTEARVGIIYTRR